MQRRLEGVWYLQGGLSLLMLFGDAEAAADLFRGMRWINGVTCPKGHRENVTKYCKYRKYMQRYICKDCNKTFNKTGTLLHYRRIEMGGWMLAVWLYLYGPLNDKSINYISESIGRTYRSIYYMVRRMMGHMHNTREKVLSGICKTDEMYIRAASKGVPLETNGEDRTLPSRRAIPRGPGRGTFEKNTPMINVCRQRTTKDERDWTIFDISRDEKSFVEEVQKRIKKGSKVRTDEHTGYKKLGGAGYDHATINHTEGEYASGLNHTVHTNNCECRAGLLIWWMSKHRDISKWNMELYGNNSSSYTTTATIPWNGRFTVTLEALLTSPCDSQ